MQPWGCHADNLGNGFRMSFGFILFFPPHFFQKNISQKAFRENHRVHLDTLSKWICNFPPKAVCEKFFEIFPPLKSRKVVQNPRNCRQNERFFSPGKGSICCWASESSWGLVSPGAQGLWQPMGSIFPLESPIPEYFPSVQFPLSCLEYSTHLIWYLCTWEGEAELLFKTWALSPSVVVQL